MKAKELQPNQWFMDMMGDVHQVCTVAVDHVACHDVDLLSREPVRFIPEAEVEPVVIMPLDIAKAAIECTEMYNLACSREDGCEKCPNLKDCERTKVLEWDKGSKFQENPMQRLKKKFETD